MSAEFPIDNPYQAKIILHRDLEQFLTQSSLAQAITDDTSNGGSDHTLTLAQADKVAILMLLCGLLHVSEYILSDSEIELINHLLGVIDD